MPTVVNTYAGEPFDDPIDITVSAVGSGNTLLVAFGLADTNQPVSVTDNQSNTYTLDYQTANIGGDGDIFFYRCSNITNAPTQVSIDINGTTLVTYAVLEVSGLSNSSPLDESAAAGPTNSTTPTVGITTDSANQLVFALMQFDAGRQFTPGTGYTELQPYPDPVFGTAEYDDDVGAAGSKTVDGTLNSNAPWRIAAVSYRAAGGGGGTVESRTAEDTTIVIDELGRMVIRGRLGADTSDLTDALGRMVVRGRLGDDPSTLADDAGRMVVRGRDAADSPSASDGFTSSIFRNRGLIDETIITEGSTLVTTIYQLIASDLIDAADEFLQRFLRTRGGDDGVVIFDDFISSQQGQNVLTRIAQDAIVVSWEALTQYERNRLQASVFAMDSLTQSQRLRTREVTSFIESTSELVKVMLLTRVLDSSNEVVDSLQALIVGVTTYDGSKIRVGFDQPTIKLGGYVP